MYIPPNTVIQILHNVPLDESYEHTIYFMTKTGQNAYFEGKIKYTFLEQTYQRLKRGTMRVARKAEDLYDCNYLRYQNTAFGNKWFYAFIKSVEYINNEVSEIQFEIDVLQTWRFEFEVEPCFVERMTPKTDYIGENIIPENIELGELVYNQNNLSSLYDYGVQIEGPSDGVYTVVAIVDTEGSAVEGNLYDGVYGGAELFCYDTSTTAGIQQLNEKIASYIQKPESIIAIYTVPQISIGTIPPSHKLDYQSSGLKTLQEYPHIDTRYKLDGYTPKNYKLYTYPYNFLNFVNGSGGAMALRFEFFKDQTPLVELAGNITAPVSLKLTPKNYKCIPNHTGGSGIGAAGEILDSECLQLTNYPMCSWNSDAYLAWVAQNAVPISKSIGRSVVATGVQLIEGNVVGATVGAFSTMQKVNQALVAKYKASIAADISKGDFTNGNILVATNRQHFHGGRMSVSYQYARMIDNYFDRFGYAQNRIMKPTEHNRPCWTYIKTIGCTLQHSIPKDDAVKICQIYDNGCLFFDKDANLDMSGDNRALGGLGGYDPSKIKNGYNPDA